MKNTAIILLLLVAATIYAQDFTALKVDEKSDIIALNSDVDVEFLVASTSAPANFKAPRRAKLIQIPIDYIRPKISVSKIGKKEKAIASGDTYDWIVHSDRDNNAVYDEPNGRPTGQFINFMERFYVIEETDEYLQLIQYDPKVVSPKNSRRVNMKKAVYLGWVPKRNLLLWTHAVVISENNVVAKGLFLHDIPTFARGISTYQQMTLYNSPTLEKTLINQNKNQLFDFLYVYDKKDNNYLVGLSRQLPIPAVATKEIIKGWMPGKNLRFWTNRLCIEPNSDPKAVAERKAKGVKVTLFINYAAAEGFRTGNPTLFNKVLWDYDKYEQGYAASWRRMPILSKEQDNIYKTGILINANKKDDTRNIGRIFGTNRQLFIEAYAPIQVDQLKHPLFKHVLLLTDKELYDLEHTLSFLLTPESSLREDIIRVYKEIIKVHYGSDISFSSGMTTRKAMKSVMELPATSALLNKYTLRNLEDPKKVSDDNIRDIFSYIGTKLSELKKVIGNPKYFFRMGDNTYYWVPLDVIP